MFDSTDFSGQAQTLLEPKEEKPFQKLTSPSLVCAPRDETKRHPTLPVTKLTTHKLCHLGCPPDRCDIDDIANRIRYFDFQDEDIDDLQTPFFSSSDSGDTVITRIRWKPVDRHTTHHKHYRRRRYHKKRNHTNKKFDSTLGYPGEGPPYESFLDMVVDVMDKHEKCPECPESRCNLIGHAHPNKAAKGKERRLIEKKSDRKKGKNAGKMYPCLEFVCASDCPKQVHGHHSKTTKFQNGLKQQWRMPREQQSEIQSVRHAIGKPLHRYPYVSLSLRKEQRKKTDEKALGFTKEEVKSSSEVDILNHALIELETVPVPTPPTKTEVSPPEEDDEDELDLPLLDDDYIPYSNDADVAVDAAYVQGINADTKDDTIRQKGMAILRQNVAKAAGECKCFADFLLIEDRGDLVFDEHQNVVGFGRRIHDGDHRLRLWRTFEGPVSHTEEIWIEGNNEYKHYIEKHGSPPPEDPDIENEGMDHKYGPVEEDKHDVVEDAEQPVQDDPRGGGEEEKKEPPDEEEKKLSPDEEKALRKQRNLERKRAILARELEVLTRTETVTMHVAFPETLKEKIGKKCNEWLKGINRFTKLARTDRSNTSEMDQLLLGGKYPSYTVVRGDELVESELLQFTNNVCQKYKDLLKVDRMSVLKVLGYTHEIKVTIFPDVVKRLERDPKLDASISFRPSGHVVTAAANRIRIAAQNMMIGKKSVFAACVASSQTAWQNTVNYYIYQLCLRDAKMNLAFPQPQTPVLQSIFRELAAVTKPLVSAASTGLKGVP